MNLSVFSHTSHSHFLFFGLPILFFFAKFLIGQSIQSLSFKLQYFVVLLACLHFSFSRCGLTEGKE